MGNYSVPEEIRKLKPTGTMVKAIHGKYYVYKFSHVKEDGKWKTKMGALLGSIDREMGYIPNGTSISDGKITTVDFGEYFLAKELSADVLERLKKVFSSKDAYTIYYLALIHFVNGFTYISRVKPVFDQSYLSVKCNGLNFGQKSISDLYDDLGRRRDKPEAFETLLINESSKELAFDGHAIKSSSDDNALTEKGNKANLFRDGQLNVLMAYDINTSRPVISRVYDGASLDKVSIKDLILRKELKSLLFIVDKGFYSKENIELFSSNGNSYIIPVYANHKAYKRITSANKMEGIFVFDKSKKRSTVEYHSEMIGGRKVVFYRDLSMAAIESADYLSKLDGETYTKENYDRYKDTFGTIVLETNLGKDEEEIYRLYKKRWSIETFYDYYKNRLDVNALCLSDYYKTRGLSFVMLVTSLIYSSFKEKMKEKSIRDSAEILLLNARFLKLHKSKKIWMVENICKNHLKIFHEFGLDPFAEAKSLTD